MSWDGDEFFILINGDGFVNNFFKNFIELKLTKMKFLLIFFNNIFNYIVEFFTFFNELNIHGL
jgi:hypothetical protein